MWYTYTVEYYSALKKKESLTHATKWINFEDIMLSEISQSQNDKKKNPTNTVWFHLYEVNTVVKFV